MMTVDDYLAIPFAYGRWLGGLRWSANGEAVEYATTDPEIGLTFAMSAQIDLFLEGLAAEGRTLHFAYVLHLLHLLGDWKRMGTTGARGPSQAAELAALARAFHETGRPLRNAGALCASLCRDIPTVPDPPRLSRVRSQLSEKSPMRYAILRTYPGEVPPLEPPELEAVVRERLRAFSADALAHWLRHGRGPVDQAGEAVARVVPRTLGELLTELESRPRLRASAGLVARLSGALALPPRRLAQAELPLGGYSDVANRGQPEQILPGQFALDTDEFLRRFAERELLYFHREEPHTPTAKELILLVDQGVRTWGDVRVILAAAALALGRLADRRGLLLRIATTGNGGVAVEADGMGVEGLGSLLEASDLTPNPAGALGRVLAGGLEDEVPRDVLLLTHPRSLAEPDVAASAHAPALGTRLFAVAVDAGGDVVLSELRRGVPVAIGRCRVEVGEGPTPATSKTSADAGEPSPWRGDVEPIGFPFPIGATEPIDDRLFDFDDAGDLILLADRFGMLCAWRADGSGAEMLPRATVGGRVLGEVEAVVGVAGGFVVAGRVGDLSVAAHYNFADRTCTAHVPGLPVAPMTWTYLRELHSIVAGRGGAALLAIDLGAARDRAIYPRHGNPSTRARDAYQRAEDLPPELLVIPEGDTLPMHGRALCLRPRSGAIGVRDEPEAWQQFTPQADGRPKFKGGQIVRARWRGDVLAVVVGFPDGRKILHAFSASGSWRSLGESPLARDVRDFALSRDGRRLAWRVGGRQLEVRDVVGAGPSALVTPKGRVHDRLHVLLGDKFLAVLAGRHAHLVRWDRGPLVFTRTEGSLAKIVGREFAGSMPIAFTEVDTGSAIRMRMITGGDDRRVDCYDDTRFFATATEFGWKVAVDRLGQVAISGGSGLTCIFFIFRDQIAAWAPDGTRLGPMSILGRPPTPDGAAKIGVRLRGAIRGEGGGPS